MNFRPQRTDDIDLNITPLIDIVFLLLIFFMVTTTFERESEISITLPESSREQVQTQDKTIEISIDKQGRVFVDGQALVNSQSATIREALDKAVRETGKAQPPLIINADAETAHQSVIKAMDAARQLGLRKVTFATRVIEE